MEGVDTQLHAFSASAQTEISVFFAVRFHSRKEIRYSLKKNSLPGPQTFWRQHLYPCKESRPEPSSPQSSYYVDYTNVFNPLNTELNPICYLLALLGAHHFLHVSRIRVKSLILRLLMSYIYIYTEHLFLMFLDHTRRTTVGRTPLDE